MRNNDMQDLDLERLPLGSSTFSALRAFNQIYVDKTNLIYRLACGRKKIFLARPRRFGKSLLTSTFESLFKYGLRDFKGLAIEKLWNDKTYDVVHLDFSTVKEFTDAKDFKDRFEGYLSDKFGHLGFIAQAGRPVIRQLSNWLEQLPVNSLVYIIDEYDAPLTACLDDPVLFKAVRSTLNEFFTAVKAQDGCNRFFFMTGITKFSSTGIFSGFNNFTDISMDTDYGALLGLTEDEIKGNFGEYLENASQVLNLPIDAVLDKLCENYDGFCFDQEACNHVYCPWSVLNFLQAPHKGFQNYWYASAGQPAVLTKYLKAHTLDDPKHYLQRPRLPLSSFDSSLSYDQIQTDVLLTQAGYLTFKKIDDSQIVTLGYPNQEVSKSMAQLYAQHMLRNQVINSDDSTPTVKQTLTNGSVEDVFKMFNRVVNTVIYTSKAWVDEEACRSSMHVLLLGAALLPRVESPTGLGRSDMDVEIADRYWVFEFKFAKTPDDVPAKLEEAVEQIQSRRYGETAHGKTLIRVALVFCGQTRQFADFREV